MLSGFFISLASGLTSFTTSIVTMIVSLFKDLFCVTAEGGAVTGITPIAEIAIAFIAMGLVYKILPTVLSWFKLGSFGKRKSKKATA